MRFWGGIVVVALGAATIVAALTAPPRLVVPFAEGGVEILVLGLILFVLNVWDDGARRATPPRLCEGEVNGWDGLCGSCGVYVGEQRPHPSLGSTRRMR